jgi:hypothetical protein
MSTRRTEELIGEIRSLSYQEMYSTTEGWNNNTIVSILNLALDKLYIGITQKPNPAYIQQTRIDVVANQTEYAIPLEVQMAVRLVDVRFLYGTQEWEYITLEQGMIQDRWNYPTNLPSFWCIRNGYLLLSPAPSTAQVGGLIINYQKRMRSLDIRRGKVTSFTNPGGGPATITVNYTVTSQKDTDLQAAGDSVLDKVDYICLVDVHGEPIVTSIPVATYNFTTQVITTIQGYEFTTAEAAALTAALAAGTVYIVSGYYASSNSELDIQCEQFLIEAAVARLLDLQSNAQGTTTASIREEQALNRLIEAFSRYRPSVYPVRWVRSATPRNFPFSPRGIV